VNLTHSIRGRAKKVALIIYKHGQYAVSSTLNNVNKSPMNSERFSENTILDSYAMDIPGGETRKTAIGWMFFPGSIFSTPHW